MEQSEREKKNRAFAIYFVICHSPATRLMLFLGLPAPSQSVIKFNPRNVHLSASFFDLAALTRTMSGVQVTNSIVIMAMTATRTTEASYYYLKPSSVLVRPLPSGWWLQPTEQSLTGWVVGLLRKRSHHQQQQHFLPNFTSSSSSYNYYSSRSVFHSFLPLLWFAFWLFSLTDDDEMRCYSRNNYYNGKPINGNLTRFDWKAPKNKHF